MTERSDEIAAQASLAFAPLHKRAFGMSIGIVLGGLIWAITMLQVLSRPEAAPNLHLLAQYYYGYDVSTLGAFIGLGWGGVSGFVMGWFLAFTRNFVIAVWLFVVRTKAELSATRDFLDHI